MSRMYSDGDRVQLKDTGRRGTITDIIYDDDDPSRWENYTVELDTGMSDDYHEDELELVGGSSWDYNRGDYVRCAIEGPITEVDDWGDFWVEGVYVQQDTGWKIEKTETPLKVGETLLDKDNNIIWAWNGQSWVCLLPGLIRTESKESMASRNTEPYNA